MATDKAYFTIYDKKNKVVMKCDREWGDDATFKRHVEAFCTNPNVYLIKMKLKRAPANEVTYINKGGKPELLHIEK